MDKLVFVSPDKSLQRKIMEYREEFLHSGDTIDGSAGLRTEDNFENWLKKVKNNSSEETVQKGFVPSTTYLVFRDSDKKLVGMVDIRHRLNNILQKYGGHIGYSVRASDRRKGYAKEILRMALDECRKLGLDRILVMCYKDNVASAKTIVANGGVLEKEVMGDGKLVDGDKLVQRYWIDILK